MLTPAGIETAVGASGGPRGCTHAGRGYVGQHRLSRRGRPGGRPRHGRGAAGRAAPPGLLRHRARGRTAPASGPRREGGRRRLLRRRRRRAPHLRGVRSPRRVPGGPRLSADGAQLWGRNFGRPPLGPVDTQTLEAARPCRWAQAYGLVLVRGATSLRDRLRRHHGGHRRPRRGDRDPPRPRRGHPLGLAAAADGSKASTSRWPTATSCPHRHGGPARWSPPQKVGEPTIADARGQPLPASSPAGITSIRPRPPLRSARRGQRPSRSSTARASAPSGPSGRWYPAGVALSPDAAPWW